MQAFDDSLFGKFHHLSFPHVYTWKEYWIGGTMDIDVLIPSPSLFKHWLFTTWHQMP
jgi:hypothetical protein